MNAPIKINPTRLQSMLAAFLRERGQATATELQDDLRKAGIVVTERRVTTNLASLAKKGDVERQPCKYGRRRTTYFPVYASNDTSIDELATMIVKAIRDCGYPLTLTDVGRQLGMMHRRYHAVTTRRLASALGRLVDRGELVELEEDAQAVYKLPPTRNPEPVQLTDELIQYVRDVVPLVCDRRRKHGAARGVAANGFPRLFTVRGEDYNGDPVPLAELRWRQRGDSGDWRLIRACFAPYEPKPYFNRPEVDVTVGDWQDTPPSYD